MPQSNKEPYFVNEAGVPILTFIDPLVWPEATPEIAASRRLVLDEAAAIRYFCAPGTDAELDDVVERYREIDAEETDGPLVTTGMLQLLNKLVWPLRHAKASYAVGNYLGTIALCGMIGETVALFIFEVSEPSFAGGSLDGPAQERLFGRTFEQLDQSRREDVLFELALISEDQKSHFGKVRQIRRKHLHSFVYDSDQARVDALTIYNRGYRLLFSIGPADPERWWELSPKFEKYLKAHGVPVPLPPPPPTKWRRVGPNGEVIEEIASFPEVRRRRKS